MVLFEKYRKRKSLRLCAILLFSVGLFQAVVFNPISVLISSDVVLDTGALLFIFDILGILLDFLFYWIALTFIVFFVPGFSKISILPLFGIYGGAVVSRYVFKLLSTYYILGFPIVSDFLTDLLYLGAEILLDLLIWGISLLLVIFSMRKHIKNEQDVGLSLLSKHVPFAKLIEFKNPISRSMLLVAIVPSSFQIIYRILYDVFLIRNDFFNHVPIAVNLLWMVIYYVSDIITILIGYFFMLLLINHLMLKGMKSKMLYEQASDTSNMKEES